MPAFGLAYLFREDELFTIYYKTVEVEAKRYTSYEELKYSVKKGNEFSYINETNTPFREEKDE